jgi:hypothetical protein
MKDDKRRQIRYDVECPVEIVTPQGRMTGHTRNLSGHGAFICCQQPLKLKEHMNLSVKFPDGSFVEVSCRVVWSCAPGPGEEDGLCGMGVRIPYLEQSFL